MPSLRIRPRRAVRASLESFGALVLVRDPNQGGAWTNQIAPEHLHIQTKDADLLVNKIASAGAIFLGGHTPVALGDYAAGPSDVLPTGGTARFASGLSANDWLCCSSVLSFTPEGLEAMAADVSLLAAKEGLTAHAASVDMRLNKGKKQ